MITERETRWDKVGSFDSGNGEEIKYNNLFLILIDVASKKVMK